MLRAGFTIEDATYTDDGIFAQYVLRRRAPISRPRLTPWPSNSSNVRTRNAGGTVASGVTATPTPFDVRMSAAAQTAARWAG
ncbi:hypothetical protein SAMN04488563_5989 [Jiangella alkaliphila]|uniref:Uncharacterized protein n=2 Tax=Jiangella alkaliphila TaxID=419479 RepID=A0A1H2LFA6_9ACTN|nr:hypothetical protein SAMN04488563_5989 [Jiangella alkaliphila]